MAHMRDWFHTGGQREREKEKGKKLSLKKEKRHTMLIFTSR